MILFFYKSKTRRTYNTSCQPFFEKIRFLICYIHVRVMVIYGLCSARCRPSVCRDCSWAQVSTEHGRLALTISTACPMLIA